MTDRIVNELMASAEQAAKLHSGGLNTRAARAAYAKGIRDMASLVMACANAAQKLCDEQDRGSVSRVMLQGYTDGLRHIVKSADAMIPPGYEP